MTHVNGFSDDERVEFAASLYSSARVDTLAEAMGVSREQVVLSAASTATGPHATLEVFADQSDDRLAQLRDEYSSILKRIAAIKSHLEQPEYRTLMLRAKAS